MKTYPIELRQKIVDAVDQQLGTYKEIAETFGVAEIILRLRRCKSGRFTPTRVGTTGG